jgi:hypothetical protein
MAWCLSTGALPINLTPELHFFLTTDLRHLAEKPQPLNLNTAWPWWCIWSLIPLSEVLLDKVIDTQLVMIFPAYYSTQIRITVFTRACQLFLS